MINREMGKDGIERFSITELGEHHVVEQMGGQDVLNVVNACLHVLATRGNYFGTKLHTKQSMAQFLAIIPIVRMMKHAKDWDALVAMCEKLLEEETKWFEKNPHSLDLEAR